MSMRNFKNLKTINPINCNCDYCKTTRVASAAAKFVKAVSFTLDEHVEGSRKAFKGLRKVKSLSSLDCNTKVHPKLDQLEQPVLLSRVEDKTRCFSKASKSNCQRCATMWMRCKCRVQMEVDEGDDDGQDYYYDLWKSELFKTNALEKENERLELKIKLMQNKLEKECLQQIKISLEWRKTVTSLVDENTRLKKLLALVNK
jgi:hypothetical protein